MTNRKQQHRGSAAGTFALVNQMARSSLQALLQGWLPDGHLKGSEWLARNPLRTDHQPGSFKININTGQWADFATGDKGGDPISLFAYLQGISQGEAAYRLAQELRISTAPERGRTSTSSLPKGVGASNPSNIPANVQPRGCRLEDYAQAKRLALTFLKELDLTEITYQASPAVRIPYRDEHGQMTAIRFRTSLEKSGGGDDRFRWKNGSKPCLYGLWRLQKGTPVTLVEGESDSHTLWHYGINAVGVPGASIWKEERDASHLLSCDPIYVVVEPDQGGEAMLHWIKGSALRDRIRLVQLGDFKDPSAMHLADPDKFQERWQAALDASVAWSDEDSKLRDMARKEDWSECKELALRDNILDCFATELEYAGLVGVEREAKLLYLAVTSRLLDRPISIAVKGPSSAGKSFLVETVLSFFCPSTYYALTAMSERVLAYGEEPLQHRMLVLYEADGMNGEMTSYLIRSLLSEGRIRYETVEKTSEGLRPRLIERPGPTGLIVTTTRDRLHPENETRLISITVVDTQEQTRAILQTLAVGSRQDSVDRLSWMALQRWIASSEARVTIPFAQALADLIPPVSVRLRRDFKLLLNLIKAHALLHQATRMRDDEGCVVATLQDYAVIYDLVVEFIAEGVRATVSAPIRETVEAVRAIAEFDGTATVSAVAAYLSLDISSASRRCATAAQRGYLRNEERSRGRPARYVVGEPLPQDQEILPTVAALLACQGAAHDSACTFAGDEPEQAALTLRATETLRRRLVL